MNDAATDPFDDAVIIRPACRDDAPGIWAVRYAVTENTLATGKISHEQLWRALEDEGRGWVAEDRQGVLGFAIGLVTGSVWALFVRPEAEGRGLGSRLHAAMLEWFAQQPLQRLYLSTGSNTRARRFYEARGWRCVGPCGADEVRLERDNVRVAEVTRPD